MTDKERAIGATVSLLRDAMPQQTVADAMSDRGHRWTQSTVWAVEKGQRRLLLSEAAELAEVLGVSVEMLLKRPDEAALQSEIAGECRTIRKLYDEAVWAMHDLSAAQGALQSLLKEAKRTGVLPTLATEPTPQQVEQMTARQALDDATTLGRPGQATDA